MTGEIAIENLKQSPIDAWKPGFTDFVVNEDKSRLTIFCPSSVFFEFEAERRSVSENLLVNLDPTERKAGEILNSFSLSPGERTRIMNQVKARSTLDAVKLGDAFLPMLIMPALTIALAKEHGRLEVKYVDDPKTLKAKHRNLLNRFGLILKLIKENSFGLVAKEK